MASILKEPAHGSSFLQLFIIYMCLLVFYKNLDDMITTCTAQLAGFVSIDCGSTSSTIYKDSLGIEWTADTIFIKDGEVAIVTGPFGNIEKRYESIRYFEGNHRKYCYVIDKDVTKGSFYLVRASFWIGQDWNAYDTQMHGDGVLKFKLIIDGYEAADIVIDLPQLMPLNEEVYMQAQNDCIAVCLSGNGATSSDAPFISSLEVRPLLKTMYFVDYSASSGKALRKIFRVRYGAPKGSAAVRFPADRLDRIWTSNTNPIKISTHHSINTSVRDSPPMEVLQRSYIGNWTEGFNFGCNFSISEKSYFYTLYFAEIDPNVDAPGLRTFKFVIDDSIQENKIDVFGSVGAYKTLEYYGNFTSFAKYTTFSFQTTNTSKYTPFISAVEIFQYLDFPMTSRTYFEDVAALDSIKASFPNLSNYTGDPCFPQNYGYPWLSCTINNVARVTSIFLSSYGLKGEIPGCLNNLTFLTAIKLNDNSLSGSIPDFSALLSLEILDLSNNNLSGIIPESLSNLINLKTLYLQNNNLYGDVPKALLNLDVNCAGNPLLSCLPVEQPTGSTPPAGKKSFSYAGHIIGIAIIISIVGALGIALFWIHRKRESHKEINLVSPAVVRPTQVTQVSKAAHVFTSQDIEAATNHYSRKLGGGGFGQVYQGRLPDGSLVAVKVLSQFSQQGIKEFLNEIHLLTTIHHKNVVQMIGCCTEKNLMLVYEYMPGGSLLDCLHGPEARNAPLTWQTRLQIMIDVANGLDYLHHGCHPQIIHRDVKSSNILLSREMDAKIADLGISRLTKSTSTQTTTALMGSWGYLDPEYTATLKLTKKVDVYSFGVLLLEVVCGRFPIISLAPEQQTHIVEWVRSLVNRGKIEEIVDRSIQKEYNVSAAWNVVDLAMRCVELKSIKRPSMDEVCMELRASMGLEMKERVRPASLELGPSMDYMCGDVQAR